MIKKEVTIRLLALAMISLLMMGCRASGNQRAPIDERGGSGSQVSTDDGEAPSKRTKRSMGQRDQDAPSKI